MLTSARLGRLWQNARYRQLLRELLAGRPEADLGLHEHECGPMPAAAVGLLRLGELRQGDLPVARPLLESVLWSQHRNGAWGEGRARPILTSLCIRGLCAVSPNHPAVEEARAAGTLGMNRFLIDLPARPNVEEAIGRGIRYLAWAQAPGGEWCDGLTTAFVLLQLGRLESFRSSVRIDAALARCRGPNQTSRERLAWTLVFLRCGGALRVAARRQASTRQGHGPAPLFANVA